MNAKTITLALIAAFSQLGASLVLLFSGDKIRVFSDISQVQYAVAIITAAGVGLGILKAALTDSPEQSANKQAGFVHLRILGLLTILSALFLHGCQIDPPQTPRQTLLAAYASAQTAANAIEIAKRDNLIDADKRDELLGKVKQAALLLDETRTLLANDPAASSVNGSTAAANLRAAQNILLAIQAAIPKERTP